MRIYENGFGTPTSWKRPVLRVGQELPTAGNFFRTLFKTPVFKTPVFKTAALIVSAAVLSACATQDIDEPVAEMTRAETAIQSAIQAGARDFAPVELQSARGHFSEAQEANAEEDHSEALRFAEKAKADADLAQAKAQTAASYETVAELKEGIRVLQEEIQRDANR